jgi:hypothetical protein
VGAGAEGALHPNKNRTSMANDKPNANLVSPGKIDLNILTSVEMCAQKSRGVCLRFNASRVAFQSPNVLHRR